MSECNHRVLICGACDAKFCDCQDHRCPHPPSREEKATMSEERKILGLAEQVSDLIRAHDALRTALEEIGCIGTTALSCRKTTHFPVERWCVRCQALAGQKEGE